MIPKGWISSLKFADFRILSFATVFHSVGFGMDNVVLGWLVFELTDSPFMVGLASALRMIPLFLLGIFSGVWLTATIGDYILKRRHLVVA
ncbi:MAG: hypothetical protein CM1200mP3_02950 [Chloroflexota bacterium]|nr:MAG: hypothetical protein CM1200mP3_02950 [Chloroflexota bacterium]